MIGTVWKGITKLAEVVSVRIVRIEGAEIVERRMPIKRKEIPFVEKLVQAY